MKKFIITTLYSQGSQAAVQGGHASDEHSLLMHQEKSELSDLYWEWSKNHKTYVYLEVGQPKEIVDLYTWLKENEDSLNVSSAIFKEEALNDTVTAMSLVAPSKLCEGIQFNVKNLLNKLKEVDDSVVEFDEKAISLFKDELVSWKDLAGYFPVQFFYDKESEGLRVVVHAEEKKELGVYNIQELNFFLKFRFLRLAK